jgi:hypothetical protein
VDLSELQVAIRLLGQAGGTVRERPAMDQAMVDRAEDGLGLRFPEAVKAFYRLYECLQVGADEFVWVRLLPDLLARIRVRDDVPRHYLPVLPDGMGGYYYVVCAERNGPTPADFGSVFHDPEGGRTPPEFCTRDFLEFAASRVERALAEVNH